MIKITKTATMKDMLNAKLKYNMSEEQQIAGLEPALREQSPRAAAGRRMNHVVLCAAERTKYNAWLQMVRDHAKWQRGIRDDQIKQLIAERYEALQSGDKAQYDALTVQIKKLEEMREAAMFGQKRLQDHFETREQDTAKLFDYFKQRGGKFELLPYKQTRDNWDDIKDLKDITA